MTFGSTNLYIFCTSCSVVNGSPSSFHEIKSVDFCITYIELASVEIVNCTAGSIREMGTCNPGEIVGKK